MTLKQNALSDKTLKDFLADKFLPRKSCQKIWDDESDQKLIEIVSEYGTTKIDWRAVGEKLNKTRKQCHSRYYRVKPGVDRGKWSEKRRFKGKVTD